MKCDQVNPNATGAATEACPACGAVHAKVEAARAAHDRAMARARAPVVDLVSLRRTLGKEGPGPDVALSPEQLMLLFTPSASPPSRRRLGSVGWGLFLGVMLGFIAMSWSAFQRMGSVDLTAADTAPPPSETPPTDIDPRVLIQEMRANPPATVAHWKNQNVRVHAPIVSLGENPYVHRPVLKLHSGDSRTPIHAELMPEDGPAAQSLGVAESATVVCSTVRWGGDRLLLKGCHLVR